MTCGVKECGPQGPRAERARAAGEHLSVAHLRRDSSTPGRLRRGEAAAQRLRLELEGSGTALEGSPAHPFFLKAREQLRLDARRELAVEQEGPEWGKRSNVG